FHGRRGEAGFPRPRRRQGLSGRAADHDRDLRRRAGADRRPARGLPRGCVLHRRRDGGEDGATGMNGALEGRVALVTGAAQGIGAAIARALAASGAKVVVADPGTAIDGQGADPTLAEAVAKEVGGLAFTESIASPSAAQAAIAAAVAQFGGIDILVN